MWSMTSSDNRVGLRLQKKSVSFEAELEIDLPVPWAAREMPQSLRDLSFGGYGENVPGSAIGPDSSEGTFSSHTR